jgi:hypothetical protein
MKKTCVASLGLQLVSTEDHSGVEYSLNVVVPDVRCQFPGLESACRRIICFDISIFRLRWF